jgi:3'-5' exoribonuclease
MTPEAMALHCLDKLDAKLQLFDAMIKSDVNTDSNWTTFHPQLGRKLFKANLSADSS